MIYKIVVSSDDDVLASREVVNDARWIEQGLKL